MNGISLMEMNGWLTAQLAAWRAWAADQPGSDWLTIASGNERFTDCGTLFRHAFSPLHRYSDQAVASEPVDDSHVDPADWEALSAWAETCLARHREVCADLERQPERGIEPLVFRTRSAGELCVERRLALAHAATHCFWHLGGIAQLLRARGIAPPQRSDLIFFGARLSASG